MNRAELVERLRERLPLLRDDERERLVHEVVSALIGALRSGRRIEIRNFGVFSLRQRDARLAHNPRTGDRIPVPAKRVPHFRAGKNLMARVNGQPGLRAEKRHSRRGEP